MSTPGLVELYYGTLTRPDASGARDKGVRRDRYRRGGSFPYDMGTSYGQPTGATGAASGPSHRIPTPDDVPDGSPWEDVLEVLGSPILLSKGGSSQIGSSIPGTMRGWAAMPPRPDDDEDGPVPEGYAVLTGPEPAAGLIPKDHHDETDDELEKRADRIWGRDDNPSATDLVPVDQVMGLLDPDDTWERLARAIILAGFEAV